MGGGGCQMHKLSLSFFVGEDFADRFLTVFGLHYLELSVSQG